MSLQIHPTAMHKCISETPDAVSKCLRGDPYERAVEVGEELSKRSVNRAYLFGCGTSHFAAVAGACAFNELADIDSDHYESFEFLKYRMGGWMSNRAALAYSHSGRTKVTCEAASLARRTGALTVAITDVPKSPLDQIGEFLVEGGSGVEPVNPKTRSFVTTVVLGNVLAAAVKADKSALGELQGLPDFLRDGMALEDQIKEIAAKIARCTNVFIVGGGANFATAQEIALKFKECTPIAAEGLEVEDALHGPISALDADTLVIGLSTEGPSYDKVGNYLAAASTIGCPTVSFTNVPHNSENITTVKVPFRGIRELFTVPLLALPAYLLVYYATIARGVNPDCPKKCDVAYTRAMASIPTVAY